MNLIPGTKLYQSVIDITNDLTQLIGVGTLNFYNLPLEKSDLGGIPVMSNITDNTKGERAQGWRWLDIDFLNFIMQGYMHPILHDLRFLITFRYIMATYKIIRCRGLTIAKIRIYAVPLDIKGSRFLLEWRLTRPKRFELSKNFKSAWHNLINYLDYSLENWHELNINHGILLIPCISLEQVNDTNNHNLVKDNFHIHRWCHNLPYKPISQSNFKQTLSEKVSNIYNNIPSPDISKYYNKSITKNTKNLVPNAEEVIVGLIHNMLEGNNSIPGVKTQLYPFQIKSLSKMYEKESLPETTLIPNFIELKSCNNFQILLGVTSKCASTYYFDITNNSFYLEPEVFQQPRGGILAENMGLGKTLICLSLICMTKWEISTLPKDYLIFLEPTAEDKGLKINENNEYIPVYPPKLKKLEKLSTICRNKINDKSLPWKYYINELPISVINFLLESPGSFRIPLENSEYITPFSIKRSRKSERIKSMVEEIPIEGRNFRTLYYCNTTLIIVPDNLFHQWNTELKKHIEPIFLKKLFISNQFKKEIISENGTFTSIVRNDPKYFIKFDLIIISLSILSRQLDEFFDSPFLNIFWKRLIIDEGHSMNSKSSRAGMLCRDMHAERRWAVTGTPTSGLTRLHMDEEEDDKNSNDAISLSGDRQSSNSQLSPKRKYVVKNSFNEREDLIKLGNIVSNFLKIEPFHSQPKLWNSSMIRPLIDDIYGSTTSLANLLNSIVVRHSLDEVERDIKLPQLHHISVFLKPSFHNKLAINIFTAVLAVNAVSSERKDIDYMFHPANRQQLRRLITNLQRATFHWSGFKQEDIETLIHICKKSLQKRKPNGESVYNDQDLLLLKKSMEVATSALNNPRWRTIALLHEMNYYVNGLPDIFTKTFGTGVLESKDINGNQNDIGIFGAPHLNQLQDFFYKNRFINMNDDNKLLEKLEEISKPFWSNYWKNTMKQNNQKFNKQSADQESGNDFLQERIKSAIDAPDYPIAKSLVPKSKAKLKTKAKVKPKSRNSAKNAKGHKRRASQDSEINFEDSKTELSRENGDGLKITNEINTIYSLSKHNISYNSLKDAMILGTASSKLSYLASKLLENQHEKVKSIVFFEFEDSAYYLTELLDILGINYILYATFINTAQRAANLSEFSEFQSEKDGGITLIMDLRLASHGLTIISATKVYFISPVWQRSVEAQAIKRAHRIGQTNEVYVETLVLEDTLEEEIYKKRLNQASNDVSDEDNNKKKYVIDDTGMQEFILRHKFLPMDDMDDQLEYSPFMAPTNGPEPFVKPEEFEDPSSLNDHEDELLNLENSLMRFWKIYLFNKDNLTKLNSAKNQKITRDFLKDQFIKSMIDEEIDENNDLGENKITVKRERPPKKKVRF